MAVASQSSILSSLTEERRGIVMAMAATEIRCNDKNKIVPTLADVYAARQVVGRYLRPTPLVYSGRLSSQLGCSLYLKLENTQPIGSFKIRGGIYYVHTMRNEAAKREIVTASTGNHAQSVAYASRLFGARATVVMPQGVSRVKIDAVQDLGAKVVMHGSYFDEAMAYAVKLSQTENMLLIHPIDEPLLYAGVGTMHLEVFEELPGLDVEVHPIGGGSGASSACIVYKGLKPSVEVIGVQAEGAPAVYESWKSGRPMSSPVRTKAEGLATSTTYELPLGVLRGRGGLDDMVLVSDQEMAQAVRALLYSDGQVAELAGAAALAAVFKMRTRLKGRKVVIPVTGRNIQPEALNEIVGGRLC